VQEGEGVTGSSPVTSFPTRKRICLTVASPSPVALASPSPVAIASRLTDARGRGFAVASVHCVGGRQDGRGRGPVQAGEGARPVRRPRDRFKVRGRPLAGVGCVGCHCVGRGDGGCGGSYNCHGLTLFRLWMSLPARRCARARGRSAGRTGVWVGVRFTFSVCVCSPVPPRYRTVPVARLL
jgi:hypothetical protein